MKQAEAQIIIDFLHEAERLKTLLRHSWLSSGRRESVAEHSWRMALMAMLINPHLQEPVDLAKVLKMTVIHDLVEIHYKDNWAHKKAPPDKEEQERKALIKLVRNLRSETRNELISLWEEYEAVKTPEAKFAKFLDKTEVLLQHDEADIKHMNKKEIPLNLYYGKEYGQHDEFLKAFRAAIDKESIALYVKNKIDKNLYKDWV